MSFSSVMFSSKSCEWPTPQKFFDNLNLEFSFTLDPAASELNHKCDRYFTLSDNGLVQNWSGRVFLNPPYGKNISKWVEKAFSERSHCEVIVMLLPSRTDTKWFHDYILGYSEIRFIRGRLKFGNSSENAPFPSMLVIYRNLDP